MALCTACKLFSFSSTILPKVSQFLSKPQSKSLITSFIKIPASTHFALSSSKAAYVNQEVVQDTTELETQITKNVIEKVNNLIDKKNVGRLFAVVQVCGKQFKVTDNDIVVVEGGWAPHPGDEIRLEKVLLVGSADFTLVGRPLLPLDQVAVNGVIIEKTLSHTKTRFLFKKRKQYRRYHFHKFEQTYIRINEIKLTGKVNELGSTDGLKDKIF